MANDLKRVGLVFTQDGAVDFKKTLQEVNLELNKNYNQFKLVQAQWDSSTKSTEKLKAQQEYLTNAYEIQQDKVATLKMQLSDLENAENKNTTAIKKKRNELTNAEVKLLDYENKLKDVANQLSNSGEKIEEFGTKIEKVGEKIEKAGKKVSAFSLATGTALVTSAKSAIDFESAFTGVEKTVDGTEQQMAELKQGIRDMAKEIPSSTTEISAVAEAAGQLGIKTENILSFSKAMIDLGNSTNLSAEEAASQLARFANIMQMSQGDFDKLGSSIVDLGNNFATTEADIVDMAMRLAGAGKQVGLSEGQVLGLATALSSVGIEAEMGGSAISKAMVMMQNAVEQGGTKLNTVLKKTGKSLRDLELMSANDSKGFKELSQSIGMTSTEVKQLITAGTNLEDFAKISGMTTEQFKKAWKEDAAGALSAFIKGLGDAESKGESAITMLSEMGLTEVRLRDSLLRAANAGNLFNEALETGTKAWEDNTALSNEANKRYGTLKSKIEIVVNKLKDFAITIGNKLMPSITKAIDYIDKLTSWVENLNDEDIELILNISKTAVVIGPLVTIIGKLTSSGGKAIKIIGSFTQAIGVMNGKVTSTSTAINKLAGVIGTISANPIIAVTAATTALTAAMIACKAKQMEEASSLDGVTDSIKLQKEQLEELVEARNESLNASSTEIIITEELANELKQIVDENGQVKEGYENRAQYILNELNSALGTEYKLNGNIIGQYQTLSAEIDTLIAKKKADAVLSAYQEEYGQAIKNQTEATQNLVSLRQQLSNAQEESLKLTGIERIENSQLISKIADEIKEQSDLISQYGKTIENYENLQTASVQNSVDDINDAVTQMGISWERAKENVQDSIEEQINSQTNYIKTLKELYETAIQNNDEYQTKILQNQLKSEEEQLNNLVKSLAEQTSTVNELTDEQVKAWKNIAEQGTEAYNTGLSLLPTATQQKIEEATGIINNNISIESAIGSTAQNATGIFANNLTFRQVTEQEIKDTSEMIENDTNAETASTELGKKVNEGFNSNVDGKTWANDLVSVLSNTLISTTSLGKVYNAAKTIAGQIEKVLGFSLPEEGPLSDFDESMPDMIDLMVEGIEKNKNKVTKSARLMAQDINSELDDINGSASIDMNKTNNAKINSINEETIQLINESNQKIIDLLTQILARSGQKIVLDTGVLVGETAQLMDNELGNIKSRGERGN